MAVWEQLEVSKAHVAYACVGVFSSIFSLVSLFIKEKLYIGESTVALIFGLIVGPVCLDWFNPMSWGNSDEITLEITRIVLCLQIFAVAVELPRKYMLKHWLSVTLLLVPVMTAGWLIIGLFIWIVLPGLNFSASLLLSACITATDPILAQSVVSGKFAERVPGHLRNLLTAESGCNDGMAFPFIFLSMNLILHSGNAGEIVKDWICVTLLYECIFGCILGVIIGYVGRRAIRFAEEKNIIDRESFLAFYVVLSFCCAGFGSILGVDDLLVSFAAGTAFSWDGWFAKNTKESKVSTVIDLLLNYAYFIYFGAIIPWSDFNNAEIGCNVWRLIILAIVVIFLRRIPAVLVLKPFIPDIKSWREALFVGHFGPIGVGAVFAAILSRAELEASVTDEATPLKHVPPKGTEHWQLMSCVWPVTCFFIVTSIIVHGSSVAVITLGRHLNSITLTKTFTTHTTNGNGKSSWMQRLPSLDTAGRSFSLHRMDTMAPSEMSRTNTIETSGIPAKPAGGMRHRRKHKKHKKFRKHKKRMEKVRREIFSSKSKDYQNDELNDLGRERLQREKEARAATFALSSSGRKPMDMEESADEYSNDEYYSRNDNYSNDGYPSMVNTTHVDQLNDYPMYESNNESDLDDTNDNFEHHGSSIDKDMTTDYKQKHSYSPESMGTSNNNNSSYRKESDEVSSTTVEEEKRRHLEEEENTGNIAYVEGSNVIVENKLGEIIAQAKMQRDPKDEEEAIEHQHITPIQSLNSSIVNNPLKKIISPASFKKIKNKFDDSYFTRNSTSSLDSSDSNTSSRKRAKVKYHAYKMNNQLLIENEDGEIVRRYKINTHAADKDDKSSINDNENTTSNDFMNSMLSSVGLRRNSITKPKPTLQPTPPGKLNKYHRTLTPAPKKSKNLNHDEDVDYDDSINDYDDDDTSMNTSSDDYDDTVNDNEYDDEDDDEEDVTDEDDVTDEGSDSDVESETEFERQRRLHALGQISHNTIPKNDDDEEEPLAPVSRTNDNDEEANKGNLKNKIIKSLHF